MRTFTRILLVAALMATVPYSVLGGHEANASQGTGEPAVTQADDSGPLPAWWAQTVYGNTGTQAARGAVASGPAMVHSDDSGPLPAWWAHPVYMEPARGGVTSGPASGPLFGGGADLSN